jgi:hypothetical protein
VGHAADLTRAGDRWTRDMDEQYPTHNDRQSLVKKSARPSI